MVRRARSLRRAMLASTIAEARVLATSAATFGCESSKESMYTSEVCPRAGEPITVGGETQPGYGIACRQPDGAWRIMQDGY